MYNLHIKLSYPHFHRFQVVTDALVKRPKEGDPSYKLYKEEHDRVLQALARKAKMVYTRMNQIPGVSCNELKAGMYAFPRIDIPEEASKDAEVSGVVNASINTQITVGILAYRKQVCSWTNTTV